MDGHIAFNVSSEAGGCEVREWKWEGSVQVPPHGMEGLLAGVQALLLMISWKSRRVKVHSNDSILVNDHCQGPIPKVTC